MFQNIIFVLFDYNETILGYIFNLSVKYPNLLNFSGPEGTCFEGGVFPAKLIFPPDYPLSPPKMQFTCEMFHPNSEYC